MCKETNTQLRTKEILIYEKAYSYEKEEPLGDRENKHEENAANKYSGHRTACFFHLEMNTDAVKMLRYYGQLNIHMSLYIWII